jgi:hypothetical protein
MRYVGLLVLLATIHGCGIQDPGGEPTSEALAEAYVYALKHQWKSLEEAEFQPRDFCLGHSNTVDAVRSALPEAGIPIHGPEGCRDALQERIEVEGRYPEDGQGPPDWTQMHFVAQVGPGAQGVMRQITIGATWGIFFNREYACQFEVHDRIFRRAVWTKRDCEEYPPMII